MCFDIIMILKSQSLITITRNNLKLCNLQLLQDEKTKILIKVWLTDLILCLNISQNNKLYKLVKTNSQIHQYTNLKLQMKVGWAPYLGQLCQYKIHLTYLNLNTQFLLLLHTLIPAKKLRSFLFLPFPSFKPWQIRSGYALKFLPHLGGYALLNFQCILWLV